jgi:hypothetical protein
MKKIEYIILVGFVLAFTACNDDVLDRPAMTSFTDGTYWTSEAQIESYCNEYYPTFFVGYNSGWSTAYAPSPLGGVFNDDVANVSLQQQFLDVTPANGYRSTSANTDWIYQWEGALWNFAWVRKSNIGLDRIETITKENMSQEAYNHWTGVLRFFRAWQYYRLVLSFGDVPFFDKEVGSADLETMYKDRDPRGVVMDAVYDDLKYAIDNVRADDGRQKVNKYIVAAMAAEIMLFEGTWETYHNLDAARAKKYLEFCVEAANVVINSGNYAFDTPFHQLFGSLGSLGDECKEVIAWRDYSATTSKHAVSSYCNGIEAQSIAPNLSVLKSFIRSDGTVETNWARSIGDLMKDLDPRCESTFNDEPRSQSATQLYFNKYIDRTGSKIYLQPGTPPAQYGSNTNYADAPCIRLAEVVLAYIEAKAVLAEKHGGAAVTQADLDKSINAIRKRPLDAEAIAKGVKQTQPLTLGAYPNDPARDADVTPLMWEIRRERRMEFVYEQKRVIDLRRWAKITDYMDNTKHPETMLGCWVDLPNESPATIWDKGIPTNVPVGLNVRAVVKANGSKVVWNGSNAADMVGYYVPDNATARKAFGTEVYLCPLPKDLIQQYADMGYTLTQTPGWENK